ncbi:Major facilitator superfamily domain-containing protein [Trichinella spiralis]|uniref:Lysosomal dipeptide transporter MFSD1 n=1 Tax=Trichinella spiralis TaxID=6334 RepID=A0ABR3KMN5_TRISP
MGHFLSRSTNLRVLSESRVNESQQQLTAEENNERQQHVISECDLQNTCDTVDRDERQASPFLTAKFPHDRWYFRFYILVLVCFLNLGNYLIYDAPAALSSDLRKDMNITISSYNLLYDVYSWPSIVLAFVSGVLIDRFLGLQYGGILFALIILVSQIVVSVGAFENLLWIMVFGRFIFAFGGESLGIIQNAYLVKWFRGKELNLVFGITLSFARVGSTISMNILKPIYNAFGQYFQSYTCLGYTMLACVAFAAFSLSCSIVIAFHDRQHDRHLKSLQSAESAEPSEQDVVKIMDIIRLPLSLWILCGICVSYYMTIFPFIANAQEFYITKFHLTPESANLCNSLVYMMSIVMSPLFGALVDLSGYNIYWMFVSIIMALIAHILLTFTSLTPYVAVAICGFSYSLLAASLWPSVSYVVAENAIATAYGVIPSVQNFGLALAFLYIGEMLDRWGYFALELNYIVWLIVSLLFTIALLFVDKANGVQINKTRAQRRSVNKLPKLRLFQIWYRQDFLFGKKKQKEAIPVNQLCYSFREMYANGSSKGCGEKDKKSQEEQAVLCGDGGGVRFELQRRRTDTSSIVVFIIII